MDLTKDNANRIFPPCFRLIVTLRSLLDCMLPLAALSSLMSGILYFTHIIAFAIFLLQYRYLLRIR